MNLKKNLYICICLLIAFSSNGQNVDISDINFKNALLNSNCVDTNGDGKGDSPADTNNDKQIQLSEIINLEFLAISSKNIKSLEGIHLFTNLKGLDCYKNELASLDVSKNTKLQNLFCYDNQIVKLDLSKNINLVKLGCRGNKLTRLDLSQNKKLKIVYCYKNDLTFLNIRNGVNSNMSSMWAFDNPNLFCIEIDDKSIDFATCDKDDYSGWCKDPIASYSIKCR